jgi:hypothetical protein
MNRNEVFRLLCACLSFESPAGPASESVREKLGSGSIDWEDLVEAASHHLVLPALYWELRRKQLLSSIPADLCQYPQMLHEANVARNRRMIALAIEITRRLNQLQVEPVLLKGVGNIVAGLYSEPGMRYVGDIDLLVPEERLSDCVKILQAAGCEIGDWSSDFHVRLLRKEEHVTVELHQKIVTGRFESLLNAEAVIRDSMPVIIGDAGALMPSAEHRIIHNVVHTQLLDDSYAQGRIRIRHLHDFVLLARTLGDEIDWRRIALLFERNHHLGALSGYILAGESLLGEPMRREVRITPCARLYVAYVLSQNRWLWLMRAGSVVRLLIRLGASLRCTFARRRVPVVWERESWAIRGRLIADCLSRRW